MADIDHNQFRSGFSSETPEEPILDPGEREELDSMWDEIQEEIAAGEDPWADDVEYFTDEPDRASELAELPEAPQGLRPSDR
jgi:hypothetical protein